MGIRRAAYIAVLFILVVFTHDVATAGPFSWIKGSKKPDVKTFKRNLAEPLVAIRGPKIFIVEGYNTKAVIDKVSSSARVYLFPLSKDNYLEFNFTSEEQAENWLRSSYPGYKCWTPNGIEKCKK